MNEESVKRNSLKAWVLAARPKTLTAAMIPVVIACAMAYADGGFKWFPAVACCAFAGLMQIASNLINDLYDFQGWITPTAMRVGIIVVVTIACVIGCLLVNTAGIWLVALGGACVVFAFLYTTLLSYLGFGDILVLVFFGLVPVTATYYLQTGQISISIIICALACGVVIDTLLVLNNFRDREADKLSGKRTIIVTFGENFGKWFYLFLGIAACLLTLTLVFQQRYLAAFLPLLYLLPHFKTWRTMVEINKGKELNRVLGMTSRNMAIFGLLLAIGIIFS